MGEHIIAIQKPIVLIFKAVVKICFEEFPLSKEKRITASSINKEKKGKISVNISGIIKSERRGIR